MNFREILPVFWRLESATSRDVATILNKTVKEISTDLRRMTAMNLLKAERESRRCASRGGIRVYYRGFQYRYRLSNQGKSYLNWMTNVRPYMESKRREVWAAIAAQLSPQLKSSLLTYCVPPATSKYKWSFNRFEVRDDRALAIATLQLENRKLMEENERLRMEQMISSIDHESEISRLKTKLETAQMSEENQKKALQFSVSEAERLNAEKQENLEKISELTFKQEIMKGMAQEATNMRLDVKEFLLAEIRRCKSEKEYLETVKLVEDFERERSARIIPKYLFYAAVR